MTGCGREVPDAARARRAAATAAAARRDARAAPLRRPLAARRHPGNCRNRRNDATRVAAPSVVAPLRKLRRLAGGARPRASSQLPTPVTSAASASGGPLPCRLSDLPGAAVSSAAESGRSAFELTQSPAGGACRRACYALLG
jgi:hypothetical protein